MLYRLFEATCLKFNWRPVSSVHAYGIKKCKTTFPKRWKSIAKGRGEANWAPNEPLRHGEHPRLKEHISRSAIWPCPYSNHRYQREGLLYLLLYYAIGPRNTFSYWYFFYCNYFDILVTNKFYLKIKKYKKLL